ncbi:MAG: hypothetical protein PHU23_05965 [Dehalococcoidales bacterium]|nr:hypothetical protein [Dehalococcoidales bacterium]
MAKKEPLYPHIPKSKMTKVQAVESEVGAPLWRYIKGKRNKLVGVEKSESTANIWANNMREHGEKIAIIPVAIGYAVYREE